MRKINAGIIGTGFVGPLHVEALRRLGYIHVAALADVDENTAKSKSEELSIPKYYGNYKDLLADPSIEVVHICTPNFLHYQMVKDALLSGKHVICEKPLTINSTQAQELVDLAKKTQLCNAIHFNLRFYPLVHEARNMVQTGELGEILAVNGSYLQDWLFYPTDYNWRLEPDKSGDSRAVADIGSHWMDNVEFITGQKVVKLCADFATFFPVRKKPLKPVETYSGKLLTPEDYQDIPINTEDYASVLLRFENGAHGTMTVNQVAAGRKNRMYIEIFGSKRAIAFDSEQPNIMWIGRRDGRNEQLIRDPSLLSNYAMELVSCPGGHNEGFPDASKQFFKKFYQYVANEGNKNNVQPPFPTFESGLRELVVCEKIVDSAKQERWLEI